MADYGLIGGIAKGIGGSDAAPLPKYFTGALPELRALSSLGRGAINYARGALPEFQNAYTQGTELQRGLQGQQAGVLQTLLNRRLNTNPQQQLQETGNTLFSFINPNVVAPLARFDVNYNNALRMARGLSPSTFDSTTERLRNARIASGRYYDTARDVYSQLPNIYNQIRNAGVTDEMLAAGYIPQIQQGYRALDLAPLVPIQASLGVAQQAAGIPTAYGQASRANIYGYRQPQNWADRLGNAGGNVMDFAKDAASIYASLYGGGLVGGGGGATPTRPAATALPATGSPYWSQPQYIQPASAYA